MTQEDFIKKAKLRHGDKYDYSKVNYIDSKLKVCIICPTHGEFYQTGASHLRGDGCNECGKVKRAKNKTYTLSNLIKKANVTHNNKYSYENTIYKGCKEKICITCPLHGDFWQLPTEHVRGYGCEKCGGTFKLNTEKFVYKSKIVHGEKYSYLKSEYINNKLS